MQTQFDSYPPEIGKPNVSKMSFNDTLLIDGVYRGNTFSFPEFTLNTENIGFFYR